jgi:DNA-binding PadR family transcriptional regulator
MTSASRISHTSALILQTIHAGYLYGFNIMETTGLPSGTIYPALRRLEKDALVRGNWEEEAGGGIDRPRRRYYRLTRSGKEALSGALKRYPLLAQLVPEEKVAEG